MSKILTYMIHTDAISKFNMDNDTMILEKLKTATSGTYFSFSYKVVPSTIYYYIRITYQYINAPFEFQNQHYWKHLQQNTYCDKTYMFICRE